MIHWIRNGPRKWHAWASGASASVCGRLNVAHLRALGDLAPKTAPPLGGDVCAVCASKTGLASRIITGEQATKEWAGIVGRHLKHARVRAANNTIVMLAVLLSEIGPPADPAAQEVFTRVKVLFLTPQPRPRTSRSRGKTSYHATLPYVRDALALLPTGERALLRIAEAIRAWQTITQRDPTQDRFRPDRIVATILQIPAIEPYVRHVASRGFNHLAAIFHPNTLERCKHDANLRGLFAGAHDYWTDTADQLNVVTE